MTTNVMPAPVPTDRILLVDDEPDLRQLVTFNLREAGFEVDAVGSGQAGLALAGKIRQRSSSSTSCFPTSPAWRSAVHSARTPSSATWRC